MPILTFSPLDAALVVAHEETAAVAAAADSDMPGDLPAIAWSEVEMAECEAMCRQKPAGEREDVLTLIHALRLARARLAEALDAYERGRDALRRECDHLREEAAVAGRTCHDAIHHAAHMQHERDDARQAEDNLKQLLDFVATERDDARAAGRALVAENAMLRRAAARLRECLAEIASRSTAFGREIGLVAENAQGGPETGVEGAKGAK